MTNLLKAIKTYPHHTASDINTILKKHNYTESPLMIIDLHYYLDHLEQTDDRGSDAWFMYHMSSKYGDEYGRLYDI